MNDRYYVLSAGYGGFVSIEAKTSEYTIISLYNLYGSCDGKMSFQIVQFDSWTRNENGVYLDGNV